MGVRSRYLRRMCAIRLAGVLLGASLLLAPSASAAITNIVFTLHACSDAGSGSYLVPFEKGEWDPESQTFIWSLCEPAEICDDVSGERLATLLNAEVFLRTADAYEIDVSIGVLAGRYETTFVIASPLISFPTIPAEFAEGRATATFTLTDIDADGACLTGLGPPPGTGAFRACYNGYLGEGTRFTHLIGRIEVNNGGTASAWQSDPSFGYRSVGEDVCDVSTEIAFTLTADDLAFAMTTMDVPAPDDVCIGDINGDGVIDATDLSMLLAAYGTSVGDPSYDAAADLDGSGCIDLVDASALLAVYGQTCP